MKTLDLSSQNLTAADVPSILEKLSENPSITMLNLFGNKIKSEGVKALAEGLKANKAIKVNVGRNQIMLDGSEPSWKKFNYSNY